MRWIEQRETFAIDAYRIIKSVFIVSIIEIIVASAFLPPIQCDSLPVSLRRQRGISNDERIIFSRTEPQPLQRVSFNVHSGGKAKLFNSCCEERRRKKLRRKSAEVRSEKPSLSGRHGSLAPRLPLKHSKDERDALKYVCASLARRSGSACECVCPASSCFPSFLSSSLFFSLFFSVEKRGWKKKKIQRTFSCEGEMEKVKVGEMNIAVCT